RILRPEPHDAHVHARLRGAARTMGRSHRDAAVTGRWPIRSLSADIDGRGLLAEESWRCICAGELEVRPPGAPTIDQTRGGQRWVTPSRLPRRTPQCVPSSRATSTESISAARELLPIRRG